MKALFALLSLETRRLSRRPWILAGAAAGLVLALVVHGVAATHHDMAREDSLRQGAATLLLLGGLALAIALGSAALNRDAENGHFGMLVGSGASRPGLVVGAVGARVAMMVMIIGAWAIVLQAGSVVLKLGLDGPLAVHTVAVGEGLVLAMIACAAASSVVGPAAAGLFGGGIYVLAQAVVNLRAASTQGLIGTADTGVDLLYYIAPRAVTSPMLAELQLRNAAGAAAPRVEINGNTVFVHAAGWDTVVWTLAWCVLLALVCAAGLRRRPLN